MKYPEAYLFSFISLIHSERPGQSGTAPSLVKGEFGHITVLDVDLVREILAAGGARISKLGHVCQLAWVVSDPSMPGS